MIKKRGQITLFIIIGLVLILIVGLFMMGKGASTSLESEKQESLDVDFSSIEFYANSCIKLALDTAIDGYGYTGGYPQLIDKKYLNLPTQSIPFLYYKGNTNYLEGYNLALERVAPEFSFLCDFSEFEKQGYNITKGDMSVKVLESEDVVIANVNYPLKISKGQKTKTIDSFSFKFPVKLGKIQKAVNVMLDEIKVNPNRFNLEYYEQFDLQVDIYGITNQTFVFILTDGMNDDLIEDYMFIFAITTENQI